MVDQLQVAFALWHERGHIRLDVVEHLIGSRRDYVDRAISYAHGWPLRFRAGLILLTEGTGRGRQDCLALVDDRFQQFGRRLPGCSTDVSGAHVVIVGEDAGDVAIQIDTLNPILFPFSWASQSTQ